MTLPVPSPIGLDTIEQIAAAVVFVLMARSNNDSEGTTIDSTWRLGTACRWTGRPRP
jgi:hypothetical protein